MDPYFEDPAVWQDFHQSFITYCRDYLLDRLPANSTARANEPVRLVEMSPDRDQPVVPDVAVLKEPWRAAPTTEPNAARARGVATLEPVAVPMPVTVEEKDAWIE